MPATHSHREIFAGEGRSPGGKAYARENFLTTHPNLEKALAGSASFKTRSFRRIQIPRNKIFHCLNLGETLKITKNISRILNRLLFIETMHRQLTKLSTRQYAMCENAERKKHNQYIVIIIRKPRIYRPNGLIAHLRCRLRQSLRRGVISDKPGESLLFVARRIQTTRIFMIKLKNVLLALLLSAFTISGAFAAGSPMNEDFTQLVTLSQKAIATGKSGTVEAFTADTEAAFKLSKEKSTTANSPAMQRITSKLKTALNEAKAGKVPEGTAALEDALASMKQGTTAPKFGGGS
jgi:hypothetical protein